MDRRQPEQQSLSRQQLRQQMRHARRALSSQQQQCASKRLAQHFSRQQTFLSSQRIALYLANDGEISPKMIAQLCWQYGKTVYLPVLHPVRANRLWFVRYHPGMPMQHNRYGILEPNPRYSPRIPLWGLDLLMLPLVAFDPAGGRMGMGGGYYDRTLAYRSKLTPFNKPKLIGLAHELQRVDKLDMQSWDIPLDGIMTDQQFYDC